MQTLISDTAIRTQNDAPAIGCVILASGIGQRFGSNKLLTLLPDGSPLIARILSVTETFSDRRIVVTRHTEIQEFCKGGVEVLLHSEPEQSDTIRLGLSHLLSREPLDGCLFAVSDQPLLTEKSIQALIHSFREEDSTSAICRLCWQNRPGNPVLYGSDYFEELLHLPKGKGGSVLLQKHSASVRLVSAGSEQELFDIDTKEDLKLLLSGTFSGGSQQNG